MAAINSSTFIEGIRKNFHFIESDEDQYHYYFWKGSKELILDKFQNMTFPHVDVFKSRKTLANQLTVFCALKKDDLAMNAIIQDFGNGQGEILSFYVQKPYRRKGKGRYFLQLIEKTLLESGIKELGLLFNSKWESQQTWTKILLERQWQAGETQMHLLYIPDCQSQMRKDWFDKMQLPEGYTVEEFNAETPKILESLFKTPKWQEVDISDLNPLKNWYNTLFYCSLILKKDGEIIGWVYNQRMGENIMRAASLFVYPGNAKGLGLILTAEAMRRRKYGFTILIEMAPKSIAMQKITKKYLADASSEFHQITSWKSP